MLNPILGHDDYSGLLDDVVWRYPWTTPLEGLELDNFLARGFLFGGRQQINDGYLVSNPALLAAAADPTSLLNMLIRAGWVNIVSTQRAISSSILARAGSGVATQQRMVESPEWPRIAAMLDRLVQDDRVSVGWPNRHLTPGFTRLVTRLQNAYRDSEQYADLVALMQQFLAETTTMSTAPRTRWEALAAMVGSEHSEVSRTIVNVAAMQVANQIYHLNFTAALVLSTGRSMTVTTWLDPILLSLLNLSDVAIPDARTITVGTDSASALVAAVLADGAIMAARERYLSDWRDEEAASEYETTLQELSPGGVTALVPVPLLDVEAATLHRWDLENRSSGEARVAITFDTAFDLLGEGRPFRSGICFSGGKLVQ